MNLSHRTVDVAVRLVDADGNPVAGADVTVEQTRHAFRFGNIGFDFVARQPQPDAAATPHAETAALAEEWFSLFNAATLPFYWRDVEPVRGRPRTAPLRQVAEWFVGRGASVKGHPLLWHTLAPVWLLALEDDEVEEAIRRRIRRDVTALRGVVAEWDVVNEAVILPVFTAEENAVTRLARRRGRVAMVALAFEEARAADPAARLVLNDFDLGPGYETLIAECLDAGIPIDALGLQMHMHQGYRGEEQISSILDRFARFGLPLQITETSLVSGEQMPAHIVDLNDYAVSDWPSTPEGEARQAAQIDSHYRTVVAHPAVESLTYWGITDRGAWLGAPIGLLRTDGTRKPAFDALSSLIRGEWWLSPTACRTDREGVVRVRGFAGAYRLTVAGCVVEMELVRGESVRTEQCTVGEGPGVRT